jgi:uncharacterized protein YaeQ
MLFHFEFELADVDRGVYETLDFRIVQHPSETLSYLLTRAFAYALSYQDGLEFSPSGLSDPDSPALQAAGPMGSKAVWIEIGNPSARKLHKASKAADQVIVYTYKNAEILVKEILENAVHRANELKIYSLSPQFLQSLEKHVQKNNRWSLLFQQGQLDVNVGDQAFMTEVKQHSVSK